MFYFIQSLCGSLPKRFQWTPHNLIAHPVSEILYQLGFLNASDWIHEATTPDPHDPFGRG
jgi:hypothetical protein